MHCLDVHEHGSKAGTRRMGREEITRICGERREEEGREEEEVEQENILVLMGIQTQLYKVYID